jgi:hypothetical protein
VNQTTIRPLVASLQTPLTTLHKWTDKFLTTAL